MAKKKTNKDAFKISINDDSFFERNEEDFLITEVDGEAVMMNTLNGSYWGLNSTTTDIWNLLETPLSFKDIMKKLLDAYDVDEETCRKETSQVLAGMLNAKVLKLDNSKVIDETIK